MRLVVIAKNEFTARCVAKRKGLAFGQWVYMQGPTQFNGWFRPQVIKDKSAKHHPDYLNIMKELHRLNAIFIEIPDIKRPYKKKNILGKNQKGLT